jgi:hypothetical protein
MRQACKLNFHKSSIIPFNLSDIKTDVICADLQCQRAALPNRRRDDQKGLHDCRRLHHVHVEAAQQSRQAICSIIA